MMTNPLIRKFRKTLKEMTTVVTPEQLEQWPQLFEWKSTLFL